LANALRAAGEWPAGPIGRATLGGAITLGAGALRRAAPVSARLASFAGLAPAHLPAFAVYTRFEPAASATRIGLTRIEVADASDVIGSERHLLYVVQRVHRRLDFAGAGFATDWGTIAAVHLTGVKQTQGVAELVSEHSGNVGFLIVASDAPSEIGCVQVDICFRDVPGRISPAILNIGMTGCRCVQLSVAPIRDPGDRVLAIVREC